MVFFVYEFHDLGLFWVELKNKLLNKINYTK